MPASTPSARATRGALVEGATVAALAVAALAPRFAAADGGTPSPTRTSTRTSTPPAGLSAEDLELARELDVLEHLDVLERWDLAELMPAWLEKL